MIFSNKVRGVVNIADVDTTICWLHMRNGDRCVIWIVGPYNSIFKLPDGYSLSTFRIVNLGQKNGRNENWRVSGAKISYPEGPSIRRYLCWQEAIFPPTPSGMEQIPWQRRVSVVPSEQGCMLISQMVNSWS